MSIREPAAPIDEAPIIPPPTEPPLTERADVLASVHFAPAPGADEPVSVDRPRRDPVLTAITVVTAIEILLIGWIVVSRNLAAPQQNFDAYLQSGRTLEAQQNNSDALGQYSAMIAAKPKDYLGYRVRAGIEARLGQNTPAIADDTTALQLLSTPEGAQQASQDPGGPDPSKPDDLARLKAAVLSERASAEEVAGSYAKSLTDYTAALALHSTDNDILAARAHVYEESGQAASALADIRTVLLSDPKSPAAHVVRGDISLRQGKPDLALADYTQAVRNDPTYFQAYLRRGDAYAAAHQWDAAVGSWRSAVHAMPTDGRAWAMLGWAEYSSGDFKGCISSSTRGLDLDSDIISARYNIADSYAMLSDWANAKPAYEKALGNSSPTDIAVHARYVDAELSAHPGSAALEKANAMLQSRVSDLKKYGSL